MTRKSYPVRKRNAVTLDVEKVHKAHELIKQPDIRESLAASVSQRIQAMAPRAIQRLEEALDAEVNIRLGKGEYGKVPDHRIRMDAVKLLFDAVEKLAAPAHQNPEDAGKMQLIEALGMYRTVIIERRGTA